MKRRGFLGFIGGAVASGPAIVKEASASVIADSGFVSNGICAAPTMPAMPSVGVAGRVVSWIRKVGIPEWKMQYIKNRAEYARVNGIDPDIACLRSVSGGWKAREQRRRNIEREIARSLGSIEGEVERNNFMDKMRAKFGASVGWYD